MRVVGGLYRHRELVMPKGDATRPTKDMVREAIFSALANKVNDCVVLDLFAGSGALGIEAISRGAKFAYLIDNNYQAIKAINTNIDNLKINNAKVINRDYQASLKLLRELNIKIDLLFLDPPYVMNDYQKIIDEVNPLLSNTAVVVIESEAPIDVHLLCSKAKEYRYGRTRVTILWK